MAHKPRERSFQAEAQQSSDGHHLVVLPPQRRCPGKRGYSVIIDRQVVVAPQVGCRL